MTKYKLVTGKPIHDSSGYHQITCKTGGGPVWTHNSIMSVWSECLVSLQIHHRKEPTGRYSTSESRPDISVLDTLAHPWSSDIFPLSATIDGAAASRREDRKKARYRKETYPGGMSEQTIPLVLEHYGRWGGGGGGNAENYLNTLSKRSRGDKGRQNASKFKDYWRKRIAIKLQ